MTPRMTWFLEPVIGAAFLLLWINAEIGRGVSQIAVIALFAAAIATARLVPVASLALIGIGLVGQAAGLLVPLESTTWPVNLAIPIVAGLIALHRTRQLRWVALAYSAVAIVAAAALMVFQQDGWLSWTGRVQSYGLGSADLELWGSAFALLSVAGITCVSAFWFAGVVGERVLRQRRELQEALETRLEVSEVELAVAHERNRIAQEMHDVLAHSLAVIVAQADGARYLREVRPAAVDGSLLKIAESARSALVDVRGMIDGMLDGAAAPQPTVAEIDALVASVREAGLEVTVTSAGSPVELAPGQQVAVYRIVQEGLTNALRHRGRGSAVSLVLDWRGPGLSIALLSSGAGEPEGAASASGGRGISGMIERARLAGGWLAAGFDENGDHRLTAFVPFRVDANGTMPLEDAA